MRNEISDVLLFQSFNSEVCFFFLFVCEIPLKISFTAKEIDVTEWKGDILAVGVTEKDLVKDENSKFKNLILNSLDSKLGGY